MTDPSPRGAVVVGVDGSQHGDLALTAAIDLASLEHRPVHLVHCYDPFPWIKSPMDFIPDSVELNATIVANAERTLERARTTATAADPSLVVTTSLGPGDPREVLASCADTAAVVIIGSRGFGPLRGLLLGSVGLWLSQHAACPLLVVRPPLPDAAHRIVVGADDSEVSGPALDYAFARASATAAALTVVHCIGDGFYGGYGVSNVLDEDLDDVPGERRYLAEAVAGLGEKYPDVAAELSVAKGPAATYLALVSAQADLVVVGSHHRSVVGVLLLGSVSRSVVEHAHCTVAVVPGSHT